MSMSKTSNHEAAVRLIRQVGPMTTVQVADLMCWGYSKAHKELLAARRLALLHRVGKDEYGRLVFGATPSIDWPPVQP